MYVVSILPLKPCHPSADRRRLVVPCCVSFCVSGCAARFRDQFSRLGPEQFVLAPRADPRMILAGDAASQQAVGVPPRSEGINSGVLLINVTRMRHFERRFCPNASWWRCILRQAPMGYNGAGGDQVRRTSILTPILSLCHYFHLALVSLNTDRLFGTSFSCETLQCGDSCHAGCTRAWMFCTAS